MPHCVVQWARTVALPIESQKAPNPLYRTVLRGPHLFWHEKIGDARARTRAIRLQHNTQHVPKHVHFSAHSVFLRNRITLYNFKFNSLKRINKIKISGSETPVFQIFAEGHSVSPVLKQLYSVISTGAHPGLLPTFFFEEGYPLFSSQEENETVFGSLAAPAAACCRKPTDMLCQ